MAAEPLPSFDLVVATVGRVAEPERLLASLEAQTHRGFRVLLVDQNLDDRLAPLLDRPRSFEVVSLRSPPGLSRARNAALSSLRAELVAFPDDDCSYHPELLEQVALRFAERPELDGLVGRAADEHGNSQRLWSPTPAVLTRDNLWNRVISFTIFLRTNLVERVGGFDEALGLGSAEPWSSGEEIEYMVRTIATGARIEYDPQLLVTHPERRYFGAALKAVATRDGASVGYILRKHGYSGRTVSRMFVRPLGGALVALAQGNRAQARFHLAALRGRLLGYRS